MRKLFLLSALLLSCVLANAQDNDTVVSKTHIRQNRENWNQYNPERGFFQKAYSDKGDPRFMITNEDETFSFGIGGVVHVMSFFDFNGSLDNKDFSTWNILVPTDRAPQYGMTVGSTKINFKAKSKLGNHNLIAFVSLNTPSSEERIKLRHAYISWGDFTVGRTYSFFMDLAAGPMTVDLQGPNTQISLSQPLLGFTHSFNKWTVAAALEMPSYKVPDATPTGVGLNEFGIYDEFQSTPDISAHVKYKGDFGHFQAGFLFRRLHYWVGNSPDYTMSETRSCNGYGVSLSGLINITPKLFFTFQGIYGEGVAKYLNDFSDAGMDLVLDKIHTDGSDMSSLMALPTYGGYGSFQYNWNAKFSSALVLGLTKAAKVNDVYKQYYQFDFSRYSALNLFYKINDYCTCGIEYLHGYRQDFVPNSEDSAYGHANRVNAMFSYTF